MRIAYLECFSGISGNMLLGALIDAGVGEELLRRTLASLDIGAELRISRVNRSGIASTNVEVLTEQPLHREHAHSHSHNHDGTQENGQHHKHVHHASHHRSLSKIREIIRNADLPAPACEVALRAFEILGLAEAKIHNVPVESIHFHEVGAVDSIADIVCGAVGCHALGVVSFLCSPLNLGGGTVRCAHGEFPVPAPATLALLKGVPIYSSGIRHELVTPTGAAMIRALECQFSPFPAMTVEAIGYGAGTRNLNGRPNVLRISVGEIDESVQSRSETPGLPKTGDGRPRYEGPEKRVHAKDAADPGFSISSRP